MNQRPLILVVALAVLAALFVILTSQELPAEVGSHFAASGDPDDWMTRENYVAFMVTFILVYPALMLLAFNWLPRRWPYLVNIPHCDYWLAPERKEESLKFLSTHGYWFSCLLIPTIAGVHYAIVIGHRSQPPELPLPIFFTVLGCFGAGLIVWGIKLFQRFHKPDPQLEP